MVRFIMQPKSMLLKFHTRPIFQLCLVEILRLPFPTKFKSVASDSHKPRRSFKIQCFTYSCGPLLSHEPRLQKCSCQQNTKVVDAEIQREVISACVPGTLKPEVGYFVLVGKRTHFYTFSRVIFLSTIRNTTRSLVFYSLDYGSWVYKNSESNNMSYNMFLLRLRACGLQCLNG